jgi:hypothetical protein
MKQLKKYTYFFHKFFIFFKNFSVSKFYSNARVYSEYKVKRGICFSFEIIIKIINIIRNMIELNCIFLIYFIRIFIFLKKIKIKNKNKRLLLFCKKKKNSNFFFFLQFFLNKTHTKIHEICCICQYSKKAKRHIKIYIFSVFLNLFFKF